MLRTVERAAEDSLAAAGSSNLDRHFQVALTFFIPGRSGELPVGSQISARLAALPIATAFKEELPWKTMDKLPGMMKP